MKCLNCGKVVEQAGNRPRLYCDDKCKQAAYRNRTVISVTAQPTVTQLKSAPAIANFGQPDCECMHCKSNRASGGKHTINHGEYKPAHLLSKGEVNRVTLPGDVDYEGVVKARA